MMDKRKTAAIALAIAVVLSAFALALAVNSLAKKPSSGDGLDGGDGDDDRSWSDHGCECGGEGGDGGSHEPCPAPEPCPEPDVRSEPGTTLSVLAAI